MVYVNKISVQRRFVERQPHGNEKGQTLLKAWPQVLGVYSVKYRAPDTFGITKGLWLLT
jgi:hypothetical protein